jgi:hypothetical protein
MFFESHPWKKEIERHLLQFRKWSEKAKLERARFYLGRAVFLSAFIVRKMMENRKVTDALRDRSIQCKPFRPFRSLSERVSRFSGSDIDDYDVSTPMEITISAFDLMSEIMHSYIFILVTDDCDYMTGVLVNSYHKRDEPFAVN